MTRHGESTIRYYAKSGEISEPMSHSSFEESFNQIETDTSRSYYERSRVLNELADAYDKTGQGDKARQARTESAAFMLVTRGRDFPGYFQPFLVMTDGTAYPSKAFFDASRLDHLAARARTSTNPIHASRFADVVWDLSGKGDVEMARIAVDNYLKCARIFRDVRNGIEFGEVLQRSLSLSWTIRDSVRVQNVKGTILRYLGELDATQEYRFCLELVGGLAEIGHAILTAEELQTTLGILERGARYYREKHPARTGTFGPVEAPSEHFAREFHRARIRLISDPKNARIERAEIAHSHEREGDSRLADNPLAAVVSYRDAENQFRDLGLRDDIQRVRVKLAKASRLSEDQMHEVSVKLSVTPEQIEQYLSGIFCDTLQRTLRHIAAAPHFIPDLGRAEKQLAKLRKDYPLTYIIPQIHFRDAYLIGSFSSEGELAGLALTQELVRWIQASSIILGFTFEKLKRDHHLGPSSFVEHFREWGLCESRNLALLQKGVEHYFHKDYVSALHILVIQFEDMLRGILRRANRPVLIPPIAGTHGRVAVLGSLLADEQFSRIAGSNLRRYYEVIFSDPNGINLRNNIAHGLVEVEEMNRQTVELVLYSLLTLTRFRIEESSERHE